MTDPFLTYVHPDQLLPPTAQKSPPPNAPLLTLFVPVRPHSVRIFKTTAPSSSHPNVRQHSHPLSSLCPTPPVAFTTSPISPPTTPHTPSLSNRTPPTFQYPSVPLFHSFIRLSPPPPLFLFTFTSSITFRYLQIPSPFPIPKPFRCSRHNLLHPSPTTV